MTDFPGVPGTTTVAELLEHPDPTRIKARRYAGEEWRPNPLWRVWPLSQVVHVQCPPPATLTLDNGTTYEWVTGSATLVLNPFWTAVNLTVADLDRLTEWAKAWNDWEANDA